MTPLTQTDINPIELWDTTVASITCAATKLRLSAARPAIINAYNHYTEKAQNSQLYELQQCLRGKYNQIIIQELSKKDLNKLYTSEMVDKNKPARKIYDKILTCAPHGKCPICGIGEAETLDHFAAKAYYPTFSVFSLNLAPACASCNKSKSAPKITLDNQTFHPHFESPAIHTDTWLHALVTEGTPPIISFFAAPPEHWSEGLRQRAKNHFDSFNLEKRYGIQAASEITSIIDYLSELNTVDSKREHLERMARTEANTRTNSWRAAMYKALSTSNWFVRNY